MQRGVSIAIQTDENKQTESVELLSCINERVKNIIIRVLAGVLLTIALAVIAAMETAMRADIINTEELVKVVQAEVDTFVQTNINGSAKP